MKKDNVSKKIIVIGIIIVLMLVTIPIVVSRENKVSNNPVEFTITGPTEVIAGKLYTYTFYLSPNSECDTYTLKVYWGEGMIIWEYPDREWHPQPFYTGQDEEIMYCHYDDWITPNTRTIEATAYCGNSTYKASLNVTVPKNYPLSCFQSNLLLDHFPLLSRLMQFMRRWVV